MAAKSPKTEEMAPVREDNNKIRLSLCDKSMAVEAGVISMATTNITPTERSAATTAKESMSIKK